MNVRLVVVDGPEAGRVFPFEAADSFLVGRSPKAHLVLDPRADRFVSRTHCLVDIRPPRVIVTDLGSTNGTFVNERRVSHGDLSDGDVLRVGRTRIKVVIADAPPAAGFDTHRVQVTPDRGAWEPPRSDRQWCPPGAGAEPSGDLAPSALEEPGATPQPLPLQCWLCAVDLSEPARGDGLADELPDAIYLCPECAGSLRVTGGDRTRIGPYTLLGELGRGGMGVVYKGVHDDIRRVVAIKRILPGVAADERTFRLFEREIAVQSQVAHPNLVRLLGQGREQGCFHFVVEFLSGGDANQLVGTVFKGPVPTRLAIRITLDVLSGLAALHQRGFVHRDLKPGNVLLTRLPREGFGRAKITDYGLAKSFEEAGNSLFELTREGEAAGSLMFMPPEQVLNYRYVMPPADVYAAGVTLYYLLTSQYTVNYPTSPAGSGDGPARNPIEALIEDRPIPISERLPGLPAGLARVVDAAVQKELGSRYGSAEEFRTELVAAARAEGLL
jgi:eukaryotic-like serine/threonine-protein kinase